MNTESRCIILFLTCLLFCSACQPNLPAPTLAARIPFDTSTPAPAVPVPSTVHTPTAAPSATPSATATQTAFPSDGMIPTPLPTRIYGAFHAHQTPWWLAFTNHRFVLLNTDGSGEKVLLDGNWSTSYYAMAVTEPGRGAKAAIVATPNQEKPDQNPVPMQMHLWIMKLPEGQVLKELDLVNTAKIPDAANTVNVLSMVYSIPAWSPDGRYLAFVAALDGLTADVYLYDSQGGSIQRVSREPDSPTRLTWSPDGRWLVYQQVVAFGGGGSDMKGLWVMDIQKRSARKLVDTTEQVFDGWAPDGRLISHAFYGFVRLDCPAACGLQLIDPATGKIQPLLSKEQLPGAWITTAYQPGSQWIGVIVQYPSDAQITDFPERLLNKDAAPNSIEAFAVPLAGGNPKSLLREANELGWGMEVVPASLPDRWLANYEGQIYLLNPDENPLEYTQAAGTSKRPLPSPDGRWLAIAEDTQIPENTNILGLRLFSADNQTTRLVTTDPVFPYYVYWLPDSQRLLFWAGERLFFFALYHEQPTLVREGAVDQMMLIQP